MNRKVIFGASALAAILGFRLAGSVATATPVPHTVTVGDTNASDGAQALGSPNCLAECLTAQTNCQHTCPPLDQAGAAACHTRCMTDGQACGRRCAASITGG